MGLTRLALVAGGTRLRHAPAGWPYGDQVHGTPAPDGSWFAWRLLAANNRELGRAPEVMATRQECRVGFERLQDQLDGAAGSINLDGTRGLWRWRLRGPAGLLAVSSRFYLRQRECAYSLQQFCQAVPGTALDGQPNGAVSDSAASDGGLPGVTLIDLTVFEREVVP